MSGFAAFSALLLIRERIATSQDIGLPDGVGYMNLHTLGDDHLQRIAREMIFRLKLPAQDNEPPTREALAAWIKATALGSEDWVFAGLTTAAHLLTHQYSRIVHRWIVEFRG